MEQGSVIGAACCMPGHRQGAHCHAVIADGPAKDFDFAWEPPFAPVAHCGADGVFGCFGPAINEKRHIEVPGSDVGEPAGEFFSGQVGELGSIRKSYAAALFFHRLRNFVHAVTNAGGHGAA